MRVPVYSAIASGAVQADAVIIPNIFAQNISRQSEHLGMADQAFEIPVKFGCEPIGFMSLLCSRSEGFDIGQGFCQLFSRIVFQQTRESNMPFAVHCSAFGFAECEIVKNGFPFHNPVLILCYGFFAQVFR